MQPGQSGLQARPPFFNNFTGSFGENCAFDGLPEKNKEDQRLANDAKP
jgi:hypothetical protein